MGVRVTVMMERLLAWCDGREGVCRGVETRNPNGLM